MLIFRGALGASSQDLDTWLMTIVILSPPKDRVVGPLPNGYENAKENGGDPITTYPSQGMILQVRNLRV